MPTLPTTSPSLAVLALLKTQPPLLDVRAPVEYRQSKLLNSFNAPILNDAEREQVGTTYRRDGHDAAVLLGRELVSGTIRTQRIEQWQKYCLENTDAQIMCWRGGLRSALAQQWLAAQGVQRERVAGGFKAVRHGSLHVLANPQKRWWLVSGRTGSAKTPLIQSLENGIDLEGHANHRGSAFGRRLTPQPTPVTFECALASAYLRLPGESLVVEDESRTIGRIGLPRRGMSKCCRPQSHLWRRVLKSALSIFTKNMSPKRLMTSGRWPYAERPAGAIRRSADAHQASTRRRAASRSHPKVAAGVRWENRSPGLDQLFTAGVLRPDVRLSAAAQDGSHSISRVSCGRGRLFTRQILAPASLGMPDLFTDQEVLHQRRYLL